VWYPFVYNVNFIVGGNDKVYPEEKQAFCNDSHKK
jgi:hypothetical protein